MPECRAPRLRRLRRPHLPRGSTLAPGGSVPTPKLASANLFASFRGYKLSSLPHDLAAGAVIAALSIPIAMGYAQIAGLTAGYGLLASIVAPLAFALVTATGTIVFGMDSATSAITGAVLVGLGYSLGSDRLIAIMPLFTLLTAAFLLLFALCRVGRLMRLVPIPVMNGFVVGVSVSVIVSQVPLLLGVSSPEQTDFIGRCAALATELPLANVPTLLVALASIALIFVMQKLAPKAPGSLIVLALMTLLSAAFDFESLGVAVLGSVAIAPPHLGIPALDPLGYLEVAGNAFVVALISALESLLCLETFSIRAGVRADGDRELVSFGIANAIGGLFGCAPSSASVSRTAAGLDAGAVSQVASMSSAAIVALVAAVLSPLLYALPSSCLSAIVVVALVNVIDARAIRRYIRHMKPAFAAFGVAATVVCVFGALPGVLAGVAISLGLTFYRIRHDKQEALFGVLPHGRRSEPKSAGTPDPGVRYLLFKMSGNLSFLNIDRIIDKLLAEMEPDMQAVIVKVSKVDSVDATATVKLLQMVDMLHARHIHVKLVRKMRPTNDSYTRYELGSLMEDAKTYPNVRSALAGLKRDPDRERQATPESGSASAPAPAIANAHAPATAEATRQARGHGIFAVLENDVPAFSVRDQLENKDTLVVTGSIVFPLSRETVLFVPEGRRVLRREGTDSQGNPRAVASFPLVSATLTRESTGEVLAECENGKWEWSCPRESLKPAIDALQDYFKSRQI